MKLGMCIAMIQLPCSDFAGLLRSFALHYLSGAGLAEGLVPIVGSTRASIFGWLYLSLPFKIPLVTSVQDG